MLRSRIAFTAFVVPALALLAACEAPPVETEQLGFRGTGMQQVTNRNRAAEAAASATIIPEPLPVFGTSGPPASLVYQNVQVLGDLPVPQFTRLMQAMTAWVAPEQGCAYCHAEGEALSSDSAYTKVVSRRMLQMNLAINASWSDHVGATGVTCFTCHRGNNVPQYGWYLDPESAGPGKALGNRAGQNRPAPEVAYASLPADMFSNYLDSKDNIRVLTQNPLPIKNQTGASIVETEQTYGLMMHISDSLGVNCTYCHNSRAFGAWEESSPVRTTAWYGIRLVRELNGEYVSPLASVVPEKRLGALDDIKKVNCMTCHQGAPKPLNGVSMLADYPELSASR